MGTCFFIGHRDAPVHIRPCLHDAVEQCVVLHGISHFVVGQYGAFDAMAAGAVKSLKTRYPGISLQLLLPYHPTERPISVPEGFDGTLYPFEKPVPHRLAILRANQIMIDTCTYLISYAPYPGNSKKLLEYAKRRTKQITVIDLSTC